MPVSQHSVPTQPPTRTPSSGIEDFALLLGSRLVSLAAGVAFVAITARLFPAPAIAFLAWVTILSSAAETIRGFGLTNVLTRRLPQCESQPHEANSWVATHFLYASIPLLIAPGLIAPFVPFIWSVAAAGAALQLVVNNHIYVFQAMGRFREVSIASIASTVLQRGAPIAFAWHWRYSLDQFLLAQTLLSLPVCIALTWGLRRHLSSSVRIIPWKEFWPQTREFYAAGFVRYGATQADQVLVALLFPPQTLAPYFLVRRLYSAVVVVLSAGVDVVIPQLGRRAAQGVGEVRREQARVLKQATAVCALGGCLAAANSSWLVPLVIGRTYSTPPMVIPALMLAALGYGLFSFALAGEVIAGPPRETLRTTWIAALVPLVVTPIMVPIAGVAALPISMTAGYLLASWRVLSAHGELRISAWLAGAGMAAVGLLYALQEGLPDSMLHTKPAPAILNLAAVGLASAVAYRCGFPSWRPSA